MSFALQQQKMFPANHKTVFVLDHTPYFGISCENALEFEFMKGRTPSFIPMTPISKTLWTSSLESAIEYCRIVWDLFPTGKLVRFFASDSIAHIINTWNSSQQSLNHIMNGCALLGVPPAHHSLRDVPPPDYTVLHGLRAALEVVCEPTDHQLEISKFIGGPVINRCRVICITSARDNESMNRLEEIFLKVLNQQNTNVSGKDKLLPINHCHLVIINTFPVTIESSVTNHPPKNLSPLLTTEVHSINAPLIPNKLSSLILEHYDLASTTVTGIPMKEEQSASSSANYDVEIFHASSAHTAILKGNAADSAAIRTVKEGLEYETVTLKWCTPRGVTGNELQNCTAMHRITPVDVNSRPSLCLINFLLNGRSVMLEMPRRAGGKITSHLLAAHGGEIFVHTLSTARSVLEDPPSISEGCGGRVTDYRIPDFGLLIKQNTLLPIKAKSSGERQKPLHRVKDRLFRTTKYWPLTINSTLLFNLKQYIDPVPAIIVKDELLDEDMYTCKKVFCNLVALEASMEPLHAQNSGQRMKGQKREEQYKAMWNELELFIRCNIHSKKHKMVYDCLCELHTFDEDKGVGKQPKDLNEARNQLENIGPTKDENTQRASVIRATTDSPMSPPPLTNLTPPFSRQISGKGSMYNSQRTLYEIFANIAEKTKSRPEFAGRQGDSLVAKLYPNFKNDDRGPRSDASKEME